MRNRALSVRQHPRRASALVRRAPRDAVGLAHGRDWRPKAGFEDHAGQLLDIHTLDGAAIWRDAAGGRIAQLAQPVTPHVAELVRPSPEVAPKDAEALRAAFPDRLGGLYFPRPRRPRQTRRMAARRFGRLTAGAKQVRDGPIYWGSRVQLPTLSLRFVYDGHEGGEGGDDPSLFVGDEIVSLIRDPKFGADCATRLM